MIFNLFCRLKTRRYQRAYYNNNITIDQLQLAVVKMSGLRHLLTGLQGAWVGAWSPTCRSKQQTLFVYVSNVEYPKIHKFPSHTVAFVCKPFQARSPVWSATTLNPYDIANFFYIYTLPHICNYY
jgi:hypothetical protein